MVMVKYILQPKIGNTTELSSFCLFLRFISLLLLPQTFYFKVFICPTCFGIFLSLHQRVTRCWYDNRKYHNSHNWGGETVQLPLHFSWDLVVC